jgi:ATP/maltotriose-dependent transcriptional regulator MalT
VLASGPALTLEQACEVALHVTSAASDAHQSPEARRLADTATPIPKPSPLSRRETQVLALIAESLSNQEIAERMFISTSTAMKHVEHIFEKLGVNRRMEAVRVGRQSGWLPSDS